MYIHIVQMIETDSQTDRYTIYIHIVQMIETNSQTDRYTGDFMKKVLLATWLVRDRWIVVIE